MTNIGLSSFLFRKPEVAPHRSGSPVDEKSKPKPKDDQSFLRTQSEVAANCPIRSPAYEIQATGYLDLQITCS